MTLSPKQETLLRLKADGHTIKEIARKTNGNETTILKQLQQAYAKLGLEFRSSDDRVVRQMIIENSFKEYCKKRGLAEP